MSTEPDASEPDASEPDATETVSTPRWRRWWGSRVAGELRRYLACVLLAAVVGAPLAAAWAIEHTVVVADVGTSPTRFTLTTSGGSEVRLGIAGTIYVPQSQGPLGIVATVEGPGRVGGKQGNQADLAAYVSPDMIALYAGLFHDPQAAIDEYIGLVQAELRAQMIRAELVAAFGGGLLLYGLHHLLPLRGQRLRWRIAGAATLALVTSIALGVAATSPRATPEDPQRFPLTIFDGTAAAGSTTDSVVIRALLGGALTKTRVLIDRQEDQEKVFREAALSNLAAASAGITGPREGEVAVMMQSDMHCNTSMIALQAEVVRMLRERFGEGTPSLLAIAGDLTTNGTAAEGPCIRSEAAIADGAPVAAITGNHESDLSSDQMRDAGMNVLEGQTEELGGLSVLGAPDPVRTELFGGSKLRGTTSQIDVGNEMYASASESDPAIVLVHEGYAAAAFLGIDTMAPFWEATGSLTERVDDDIRDLPAGAIFYGHWHRDIAPRVVWNDDGTWTLVMELNTSGGAIATPTLGNFSTPWSRPLQEAAFPVVFFDEESGLATGYQLYRFGTDASVTVEPRVDVGAP